MKAEVLMHGAGTHAIKRPLGLWLLFHPVGTEIAGEHEGEALGGGRAHMSFDQMYSIGLASIFMVLMFGGLYRFKSVLRKRLFPTDKRSGREDAMAELLRLQARLEERATGGATSPPAGEEGERT